MDDNLDVNALFDQAMAAAKANRHDEAKDLLLQVLRANPQHEQAWLVLAGVLPDLDQTIACLQQVLELNPDNGQAKEWLSFCLDALGETAADAKSAKKARDDDAERPVPRLGKYLLDHEFVTETQLETALQAQTGAAQAGQAKLVGEILVEQGTITRECLSVAVREQQLDFFALFWD